MKKTIAQFALEIKNCTDRLIQCTSSRYVGDPAVELIIMGEISDFCVACMEQHGGRPQS